MEVEMWKWEFVYRSSFIKLPHMIQKLLIYYLILEPLTNK